VAHPATLREPSASARIRLQPEFSKKVRTAASSKEEEFGTFTTTSAPVGEATVRRYLDLLTGVFMVRQLQPWFENLGKRQVKAPKVSVRDSGLLHALLGVGTRRDLEYHPKVGASWEGYAVEEVFGDGPSKMQPALYVVSPHPKYPADPAIWKAIYAAAERYASIPDEV
jgi:predicted AAA+ superfamily ATPase